MSTKKRNPKSIKQKSSKDFNPPVKPKCFKCEGEAEDLQVLSAMPGTQIIAFQGICPKCKAQLSWSYILEGDTESWEFTWIRKTNKKEIDAVFR